MELRGAIPLAVGVFGFMPLKAFILGTLGSLILIMPILFFLYRFSDFAMKKSYILSWRAALAIGLGAVIAGLIVLLVVLGFIALPFL